MRTTLRSNVFRRLKGYRPGRRVRCDKFDGAARCCSARLARRCREDDDFRAEAATSAKAYRCKTYCESSDLRSTHRRHQCEHRDRSQVAHVSTASRIAWRPLGAGAVASAALPPMPPDRRLCPRPAGPPALSVCRRECVTDQIFARADQKADGAVVNPASATTPLRKRFRIAVLRWRRASPLASWSTAPTKARSLFARPLRRRRRHRSPQMSAQLQPPSASL